MNIEAVVAVLNLIYGVAYNLEFISPRGKVLLRFATNLISKFA